MNVEIYINVKDIEDLDSALNLPHKINHFLCEHETNKSYVVKVLMSFDEYIKFRRNFDSSLKVEFGD